MIHFRLNKERVALPNSFEPTKCASNKLYDLDVEQDRDIPKPKDLISYARQISLGMVRKKRKNVMY